MNNQSSTTFGRTYIDGESDFTRSLKYLNRKDVEWYNQWVVPEHQYEYFRGFSIIPMIYS